MVPLLVNDRSAGVDRTSERHSEPGNPRLTDYEKTERPGDATLLMTNSKHTHEALTLQNAR